MTNMIRWLKRKNENGSKIEPIAFNINCIMYIGVGFIRCEKEGANNQT